MPKPDKDTQATQTTQTTVMPSWALPLSSALVVQSAVTVKDAHARLTKYIRPLEQMGGSLLEMYKSGQLGMHDLVTHRFINLRNELMNKTRGAISPGALAMSEYIKEKPQTEMNLRLKYSRLMQANPFSKEVSEMIMKKSIQSNPAVTNQAITSRLFGITGLAFFPGVLAFRVYKAPNEDRIYETFRTGTEVVGGMLTVWRGVPAMWAACKVAIPGLLVPKHVVVLHVVFNFAASATGSIIAGYAADKARERLAN